MRRALAAVCGCFLATEAFERLGFARLRDYAAERLGVSARQLNEFARMDRAFKSLPLLEAAFLSGQLGWAKARDVARVATPEDIEVWLEAAVAMNSEQLAREVRAVDQRAHTTPCAGDEPEWRRETVRLQIFSRGRARLYPVRELARRVCGERVSLADALDAVAAEFVSAVPLEDEVAEGLAPASEQLSCPERETAEMLAEGGGLSTWPPIPAQAPWIARGPRETAGATAFALAGLESADAFQLDAHLRRLLRFEQRFEAQIAPMLVAVASVGGHREFGFRSMTAYSADRTGASARKTKMLLRLERACEQSPELRCAFHSGALTWTQAYTLVPIALLDHSLPFRAAWIRHAKGVTVRRLEQDVGVALDADAEGAPRALDPAACAMGPESSGFGARDAEGQTRAQPTRAEATTLLVFSAPIDQARFFRAVLANTQRRIEQLDDRRSSEAETFELMVDHFLAVHSDAHREASKVRRIRLNRIFERDGWRCTFPGCTSYRHLEVHHIRFRSAGGSDRDDNLTVLCRFHHQRGVHDRIVTVRGQAPDRLRYTLGLRAGAPPLQEFT